MGGLPGGAGCSSMGAECGVGGEGEIMEGGVGRSLEEPHVCGGALPGGKLAWGGWVAAAGWVGGRWVSSCGYTMQRVGWGGQAGGRVKEGASSAHQQAQHCLRVSAGNSAAGFDYQPQPFPSNQQASQGCMA